MITCRQPIRGKDQREIVRESQQLLDIVANSLKIMAEVHVNSILDLRFQYSNTF